MTTEYKWLVQTYWVDMDAICTSDDSLERSLDYEFDTLAEAEKFMMLYRLQHTCIPSGTQEWINTPNAHEITLFTPQQQQEHAERWWRNRNWASPTGPGTRLLHEILNSD